MIRIVFLIIGIGIGFLITRADYKMRLEVKDRIHNLEIESYKKYIIKCQTMRRED